MNKRGACVVKAFRCLFCDHCCIFSEEYEMPTVFPWEKRLLEEEAEKRGLELEFKPLQVFKPRSGGPCVVGLYRWIIRGYCPFFERSSKRCVIHDVKPYACKMYPLIVEMPSGKLMVSGKCDWVKKNQGVMRLLERNPSRISDVFPSEVRAAKEAFIEYSSIMQLVQDLGLERVEDFSSCEELVDMDVYAAREWGREQGEESR